MVLTKVSTTPMLIATSFRGSEINHTMCQTISAKRAGFLALQQ